MSFNYIYLDILNRTYQKMIDCGEEIRCWFRCLLGAIWVVPDNKGYAVDD